MNKNIEEIDEEFNPVEGMDNIYENESYYIFIKDGVVVDEKRKK
ncbi:MAG: hypothetical protein ACLFS3_02215 [Candidatus Aenigmatarchaeota archaeon]